MSDIRLLESMRAFPGDMPTGPPHPHTHCFSNITGGGCTVCSFMQIRGKNMKVYMNLYLYGLYTICLRSCWRHGKSECESLNIEVAAFLKDCLLLIFFHFLTWQPGKAKAATSRQRGLNSKAARLWLFVRQEHPRKFKDMHRKHERILRYCLHFVASSAQNQDLNSTKPKPRHESHVVVIARFVTCSFCLSAVPLSLCKLLRLHSCLKLLAAHPTSASSERCTKISKNRF